LAHDAGRFERIEIDRLGGDARELAQPHFDRHEREPRAEAPLRHAHLNRRLTAFETGADLAAGARGLALVALARRLAETRADAAPEAFLRRFAAGRRRERVHSHFCSPCLCSPCTTSR